MAALLMTILSINPSYVNNHIDRTLRGKTEIDLDNILPNLITLVRIELRDVLDGPCGLWACHLAPGSWARQTQVLGGIQSERFLEAVDDFADVAANHDSQHEPS
jgi:hypothetical protein